MALSKMLSVQKKYDYDDMYLFKDIILDKAIKCRVPFNLDYQNWLFHFREDWSRDNIDIDREEADNIFIKSMHEMDFIDLHSMCYLSSHRWRYAYRKDNDPIDQIKSDSKPLYLAGDWTWGFGLDGAVHSAFRALEQSQLL